VSHRNIFEADVDGRILVKLAASSKFRIVCGTVGLSLPAIVTMTVLAKPPEAGSDSKATAARAHVRIRRSFTVGQSQTRPDARDRIFTERRRTSCHPETGEELGKRDCDLRIIELQ
jgi:hypothetical protein